jgi:hypothetical protein
MKLSTPKTMMPTANQLIYVPILLFFFQKVDPEKNKYYDRRCDKESSYLGYGHSRVILMQGLLF